MLRTIKSFISREGRMTIGQKRALTTIAMQYEVNSSLAEIDLPILFHNDNPIVLEIGFGSGDSLFAQAAAHPELNFFGIEVYRTGIAKLCNKLVHANIGNVLYACGDAVEILNKIPARSLERIQIFFPDPWPKTRHHKRRIIQPAFMQAVAQKLAGNGIIHLATDWLDYAQHMQNVLELDCNELFEKVSALRPDFRPTTKFEIKGLAKGHQIFDLLYKLK